MTKHILMLSAATAALLAVPAAAQTVISTSDTAAKKTSVTGDLTIASTGGIVISTASTPVVTMDSSNFVVNSGLLSNKNQTGATGIFINAAANPVVPTNGFTNFGTIDLTGTGTTKVGVQVSGVGTFTGEVGLASTSLIQVAGDASVGVLNDFNTTLKGNLNLGGVITITATTPDSTTVNSGGYLVEQAGALFGNLTIAQGANFTALGQNQSGVAIFGDISACDPAIPACATNPSIAPGLFFNGGSVFALGTLSPSGSKTNPEGGFALGIGANIANGAMNSGPINTSGSVTPAVLSGNGATATVLINPVLTASRAIEIGVYTPDTINPGFSFYNRGLIQAQPIDANVSSLGMEIGGASSTLLTTLAPTSAQLTADPTLAGKGGIFNSGLLTAVAASNNTAAGTAVNATALAIDAFAVVPRVTVSGETVTTANPTLGQIVASITGFKGGSARAITIASNAVMPELNVIKNGRVVASAQTSDLTIASLGAIAVQDGSGTLKTINNAGTITAASTTLNSGAQIARAIDLSLTATDNVVINNSGILQGDVLLGQSGNNHRLFVGNVGTVGTNTTTGFGSGSGAQNSATGVTNAPTATGAGINGPAIVAGTIDFGIGGSAAAPNVLHVGGSGIVSGKIYSRGAGVLDVRVDGNGTLTVLNTQETLRTRTLLINGGALNLNVSQGTQTSVPIITATDTATIVAGSRIGLAFSSFVSSPDPNAPVEQTFTLIDAIGASAISLSDVQVASYNASISTQIPFLFQPNATPLTLSTNRHQLLLKVTPKSPVQLGLTGSALTLFPYVNAALVNDNELGSALVAGVTSQPAAQAAYAQFAPDVSGGVREVAITLTDQSAGPVAARQRNLRQYADQTGDLTLWGHEFAQAFNSKSVTGGTVNAYKDRGFGFVLGVDGGSKQNGWYGGAFTFYTGDVAGVAPLTSKTNTQWYMLTGYTDWKGRHLFLDTQVSLGYGNLLGRRTVTLGGVSRTAEGKRRALMGAVGATTGATFNFGGIAVVPHISLDGMTMREEKFTETGGGNGLDMNVGAYYATSLRTFLGTDFYRDINLGLFSLRPEARVGYRFDFLNNPVKLDTQFVSTGTAFTLTGPNSNQGSFLAGLSLGASSETWSLGVNYDWLRGSHGSTTQIGTLTLLGRI